MHTVFVLLFNHLLTLSPCLLKTCPMCFLIALTYMYPGTYFLRYYFVELLGLFFSIYGLFSLFVGCGAIPEGEVEHKACSAFQFGATKHEVSRSLSNDLTPRTRDSGRGRWPDSTYVKSFIDVYLKTVQWYLSIKQCSDTYPVSNTGIYKARLKEYYSLLMSAR